MCTLSWVPAPDGFRLFFNRDERRTRARGRPPRITRTLAGEFLGPVDGDFGGTWIGVNRHGVAGAILNRYEDTPPGALAGRVSRGLLLRDLLLTSRSPADLVRRTRGARLKDFLPFTLATLAVGRPVTLIDWNGRTLRVTQTRRPGVLRTSSGSDQGAADKARRAVYQNLLGASRQPSPEALRRLHRSHLPRRGPLSACMHRPEAKTQSLTEVAVAGRQATMWYAAGSPCRARLVRAGRIPLDRR